MSEHIAEVRWERSGAIFTDSRYRRDHRWRFDGGLEVPASASPSIVPATHVDPAAIDPEEAFVAALASCHMLWFLSLAAKRGFTVERYRDAASGLLAAGPDGRKAITRVTLRPEVEFSGGTRPTAAEHEALHREAHGRCFIAASVRTEVLCEAALVPPEAREGSR
jgi:organic hydroperoxide reductase OsmC/OhrA